MEKLWESELGVLAAARSEWLDALERKVRARRELDRAKEELELVEARVVQRAAEEGRISGRNAEERERQKVLLLAEDEEYLRAKESYEGNRGIYEEAELREARASSWLRLVEARCRMIEAALRATGSC